MSNTAGEERRPLTGVLREFGLALALVPIALSAAFDFAAEVGIREPVAIPTEPKVDRQALQRSEANARLLEANAKLLEDLHTGVAPRDAATLVPRWASLSAELRGLAEKLERNAQATDRLTRAIRQAPAENTSTTFRKTEAAPAPWWQFWRSG